MNVRKKLTPTEQSLAWVIGLGITLVVIALFLTALGTIENDDITISLLIVGIAIAILGIGAWLILVRPWTEFDDLKTPMFTNENEHTHAAPATETVTATAEPIAAETAETVTEPIAAAGPADDLTQIDGIGPKTAQALAAAGITRLEQVASMSADELYNAAHEHGSRVVTAEGWPEQARALLGDTTPDDLTVIEGIGPKSQEALYAAGIRTYAALAQAAPDTLRSILNSAGLKLPAPDTWPEQAGYLVRGDLDGLRAYQDRLKGGRKA